MKVNDTFKYIDTHVEDNQIYAYAIDEHGQEVLSQKFDVSIDLKKILHGTAYIYGELMEHILTLIFLKANILMQTMLLM